MPTNTNVTNLKINELTEAQYDAAVLAGTIGANELSILTDAETGQVIQVNTMPTAAAGELDKIYQFVGTTDANYTNGYFYKCVTDGQQPATYSWSQTNVQPTPSGLPDQTGNSGKFLTTDGTDASWSDKPLVNLKAGVNSNEILWVDPSKTSVSGSYTYGLVIGKNANLSGNYGIAIGKSANAGFSSLSIGESANTSSGESAVAIGKACSCQANLSLAIGYNASARGRCSIQLGNTDWHGAINNDDNTFKVANLNGNFEIMSADGTIPTDRFTTTPVADGTYTPTVTISSGTATRSWAPAASAPVVPSTMPELTVADWSSNTQTVNVTGVTANNVVFVSPAPASAADYAAAGIVCTAQGAGTLTFSCQTVPSNAITVNVVILG